MLAAAVVLGSFLALASADARAQAKPQRIVSLDLCTDQILIDLVDRNRIAAVTHLAADASVSASPGRAKGLPITHGAAEDVLRYDPDLVLAGPFGVAATVDLFKRLKRNLVVVPQAPDLDGVRASVRAVAAAVGEEERGEVILAAFNRRLAAVPKPKKPGAVRALIYQVGGTVSGPGSLADATLAAAGFHNMAVDYRLTRGGQAPLESVVARPPDLLVLSSGVDTYRTTLADNLRHPALQAVRRSHASIELPWQLWLCGTPEVAGAVEQLAAARVAIEARNP
jgi:iron complex transport system substrate-binding protein